MRQTRQPTADFHDTTKIDDDTKSLKVVPDQVDIWRPSPFFDFNALEIPGDNIEVEDE